MNKLILEQNLSGSNWRWKGFFSTETTQKTYVQIVKRLTSLEEDKSFGIVDPEPWPKSDSKYVAWSEGSGQELLLQSERFGDLYATLGKYCLVKMGRGVGLLPTTT